MKKATWITLGLAALLPMSGLAQITVEAPSQDGGWAILYNPSNGAVYDEQQFSGGTGSVDLLGTLGGGDQFAVDVTYDSAKVWQSRVYWNSGGTTYGASQTYDGVAKTVQAVTGEITSRGYDFSNPNQREISVTYQGATGGAVSLADMNASNELDAYLQIIRPSSDVNAEVFNPNIKKLWDPTTLAAGFSYDDSTDSSFAGYQIIEITGVDFLANYIGKWVASESAYELGFMVYDDAGDTAYWSSEDAGVGNGVVDAGGGAFTFTAISTNSIGPVADLTPYYAYMGQSQIFDDTTDPKTLSYGRDGGLALLDYQYYNIPEPAALILILGGGGALFAVRRFFMI